MGLRRLTAVLAIAVIALARARRTRRRHSRSFRLELGKPAPQGQTIRAIEFDGARGYAAGDFGTVLITEDSGATWNGAATGVTRRSTTSASWTTTPWSFPAAASCAAPTTAAGRSRGCRGPRATHAAANGRGPGLPGQRDRLPAARGRVDPAHRGRWTNLVAADRGARHARAGGNVVVQRTSPSPDPTEGVAGSCRRTPLQDDGRRGVLDAGARRARGHRDVHFVTPTVGFAVGSHRVLRTQDGGATWEQRAERQCLSSIRCADAFTCIATTGPASR